MHTRWSCIAVAAVLAMASASALTQSTESQPRAEQDARVRLNQIQVIGTHNSYHGGFAPSEAAFMKEHNPKAFASLDYSHPPLDRQLDAGVRQMEIDVYADAKGGRYAHPAITAMTAREGLPADPVYDPDHVMDRPGFKVLHVAGIDQRSTCKTLVLCLEVVRRWSAAHPRHLPLFLLIETKEDDPAKEAKQKRPSWSTPTEPFTPAVFDALDAEIRSVFSPGEIITPDQVRGSHATLPEAIAHGGWPTLAESRGKVVFLLDQAHVTPVYTAGHPALKGRVLFTNATPGTPDAAFVEQNAGTVEAIDALVREGYLVRTRTDEPTANAREDDTTRRDLALRSGAQMLSTDYPASEPARWAGHYHVELPGGLVARCNPVNAPAGCRSDLLADPAAGSAPGNPGGEAAARAVSSQP